MGIEAFLSSIAGQAAESGAALGVGLSVAGDAALAGFLPGGVVSPDAVPEAPDAAAMDVFTPAAGESAQTSSVFRQLAPRLFGAAPDVFPAMAGPSSSRPKGGRPGLPRHLKIMAEQTLQSIVNQYGAYEPSHPLVRYVNRLASRVIDGNKVKVIVTKHWNEINARALPNSIIIISDRLVKFCEYEEELLFIFDHEHKHIVRGHSAKRLEQLEKIRREEGKEVSNVLAFIGQMRIHEWESDLRGFADMGTRGVNPHGGTVFFNRLADEGDGKGMAHGSSIDRTLNLGLATRLYDIAALTTDLTRIPENIRQMTNGSSLGDYQIIVSEGIVETAGRFRIVSERYDRIRTANFGVLAEALPVISKRLISRYKIKEPPHWTRLQIDEDEKALRMILKGMKEHIDGKFSSRSKPDRIFILATAIMAGANLNLLKIDDEKHPLHRFAGEFMDELDTAKDFDKLAGIVRADIFKMFGLYATAKPEDILADIAGIALETDIFNPGGEAFDSDGYFRFCIRWIRQADTLYSQRGVVALDRENSFMEMVFLGVGNLVRGQDAVSYLESAAGREIAIEGQKLVKVAREKGVIETTDDPSNGGIEKPWHKYITGQPAKAITDKPEDAAKAFGKWAKKAGRSEVETELEAISDDYRDTAKDFFHRLYGKLLGGKDNYESDPEAIERFIFLAGLYGRLGVELPDDWEGFDIKVSGFDDIVKIHGLLVRYHGLQADTDIRSAFARFLFYNLKHCVETNSKADFKKGCIGTLAEIIEEFENINNGSLHPFLDSFFVNYKFDLSDQSDLFLLYRISFLLKDPSLAIRFREMLARRIMEASDDKQKFTFLFTDKHLARGTSLKTKEAYVDENVNTLADLSKLEKTVMKTLDVTPNPSHGKLVIMDMMERALGGKEEILRILMETRRDERELKSALFKAGLMRQLERDDPEETTLTMRGVDKHILGLYTLDQIGRHALVRNLLVGNNGALTTMRSRKWLLDHLFKTVVREGSSDVPVMSVLRKALSELMESADIETLFFAIAPIIEARIARSPQRAAEWEEILPRFFDDGESDDLDEIDESDDGVKLKNILDQYRNGEVKYEMDLSVYDANIVKDTGGAYVTYQKTVMDMIGEEKLETTDETVSPLGLVVEIAGKMGSPGVRFLQILGQFVAIPSGYEREFSKVYDGMRGQTKLTAFLVLKREWKEMRDEIAEIDATVGGGSLMTAFRAKTVDGREEVIKVLNPNAEYHLEIVYKLLEGVMGALAESEGGGYRMAKGALSDIKEWIRSDIHFEGFLERDKKFHDRNDGFKPQGFGYSIKAPKSYGPENRFFKREEYIDGMNLTRMDELRAQGHDMKQIAAILVANYWQQIQDGMVHADVHPGNFRITPDRQVAVLDRNFFIELDEKDRAFMAGLITSFTDPKTLSRVVGEYLEIRSEQELGKIEEIIVRLSASDLDAMTRIKGLVVQLKGLDIHVPLKITLLIKNLNGLASIAKQAGFTSLQEAFFYHP